MLEYRPTLFLAVAASASCHYPVVQQALNTQLKEILARQVLIGGQTSLEFPQTVLVYLAWWVDIPSGLSSYCKRLTPHKVSVLPCSTESANTPVLADRREHGCRVGRTAERILFPLLWG
jgi:hypothetical protein